jgi:hypothetical protein
VIGELMASLTHARRNVPFRRVVTNLLWDGGWEDSNFRLNGSAN